MARFQRHVFVCVNERELSDKRGCCAAKGGADVAAAFKEKLYAAGLKRIVRPNKAGCLDQCARGVTIVVYPEAVWYGGVTLADVDEIVESHLVRGEKVARLEIPADALAGKEPNSAGGCAPAKEPRRTE